MVDSKGNDNETKSEAVDDSEEENEILEESPCGRWLKRREEVEQRDIPGIDATYLAMDTEEGVEVVWNEVRFSERKLFKLQEDIISEVFDRLIQLEHPNIVKLHKYWIHKDVEKPRVIFITEYMSSGSLKQFLKKTKRSLIKMALLGWKRWCTQTLSALCYLHTSQPPIIHGNLNCDTIFISHNGLIKIGAVAPDAIHKHVKTVRGDSKANLHFSAPEIGCITDSDSALLSPAVDIYSFGMCALEMAALEISVNGETTTHITDEVIINTIESLDNPLQKDFISRCLNKNPAERPSARELLFHPIIFEVPTLRLFAAHVIVNTPSYQPEQLTEEAIARFLCLQSSNEVILAEIKHNDSRPPLTIRQSDAPKIEFEKFFDEVRNGAFPLTAIVTTTRPPLISRQRTMSPEVSGESAKQLNSPDNPYDEETRRIETINCNIKPLQENNTSDPRIMLSLNLRFDDKINRQLSCEIDRNESLPNTLVEELVYYGFVNKDDRDMVLDLIEQTLKLSVNSPNQSATCEKSGSQHQQQQQQQQQQHIQQIQQLITQQKTVQPNQPQPQPQHQPIPQSQPQQQQILQNQPQQQVVQNQPQQQILQNQPQQQVVQNQLQQQVVQNQPQQQVAQNQPQQQVVQNKPQQQVVQNQSQHQILQNQSQQQILQNQSQQQMVQNQPKQQVFQNQQQQMPQSEAQPQQQHIQQQHIQQQHIQQQHIQQQHIQQQTIQPKEHSQQTQTRPQPELDDDEESGRIPHSYKPDVPNE